MPRKQKNKKMNKKRSYKKKKLPGTQEVGHPAAIFRKLRWVGDPGSLNPGAGGICSVGYCRLNSMYDPDGSGSWGNEQPRGFDQYVSSSENSTGIYAQYTVLGCRCKVTFVNTDTTNSVMVGITEKGSVGTYTNYQDYVEDGKGVYKILGPAGSGREVGILVFNWSAKKAFGLTNVVDGIGYSGLGQANPTVMSYLHIWASGFGTDTGAVTSIPQIEYIAKFHEPITPAQS